MDNLHTALNRLAKWRMIFASWQLGTRAKGDPECDAVRDHRETTILLRVEVNALEAVLRRHIDNFDLQFHQELIHEAELLERAYEAKFPAACATNDGINIDISVAKEWMDRFTPRALRP